MPPVQVIIEVTYTDGSACAGRPELWPSWPGEGVDRVDVSSRAGRDVFSGASLYWCRSLSGGAGWAFGTARCGPAYGDPSLSEVWYPSDGGYSHLERHETLPDLHHRDVKVGWWYPGTGLDDLRDARG